MFYIEPKSAMKIFYYLLAIDGEVVAEKMGEFRRMHQKIGNCDQDTVIRECKEQLKKAIDPEDIYEVIKEDVENEMETMNEWNSWRGISVKSLVWDMIFYAYRKRTCLADERKLIKYLVRKGNIGLPYFLEMENAMKTINALDKEEEWVEGTNKTRKELDGIIKELRLRKGIIVEGINIMVRE